MRQLPLQKAQMARYRRRVALMAVSSLAVGSILASSPSAAAQALITPAEQAGGPGTPSPSQKTASPKPVTPPPAAKKPSGSDRPDIHTVKSGDTLWDLAEKSYGTGEKWRTLYEANQATIESAAQAHGMESSANGHWIFPGTEVHAPTPVPVGTPPQPPVTTDYPPYHADCSKDVFLIGARGSGEELVRSLTPDEAQLLGPTVGDIYNKLRVLEPDLGVYGVEYDALGVDLDRARQWFVSLQGGRERVKEAIEQQAACPNNQRILLAGYSQGALAITQALNDLDREGFDLSRISGVTLLGSPGVYLGANVPPELRTGNQTFQNCLRNDPVCDPTAVAEFLQPCLNLEDTCTHLDYVRRGITSAAAGFLRFSYPSPTT